MKTWVGKATDIIGELSNVIDVMKKKEEGENEKKNEASSKPSGEVPPPVQPWTRKIILFKETEL